MNKSKILTIPNLLTLVRLLLVPVFVWSYTVRRDNLLTALVLGLSGVTDLLDGQIARRFDMVSDLGKMLDPVADKVTQGAMLICLLARFPLMGIPLALLAVKEVFVGATSLALIRRSGKVEGARFHGKVATVLLYALMLTHLLAGDIPSWLSVLMIALTTLSMLISLLLYGSNNLRKLRQSAF